MSLIPGGKKTAVNQNNVCRIHTVFDDGSECIEEFAADTQLLLLRKWRRRTNLGREMSWEIEVGEAEEAASAEVVTGMYTSKSTPTVSRLDSETAFVFKITNLPGPESNYFLTVENDELLLRTQNKKYFKRLVIQDLRRAKLPHMVNLAKLKLQNNTLIIAYTKPPDIRSAEKAAAEARRTSLKKDGDVQCPSQ